MSVAIAAFFPADCETVCVNVGLIEFLRCSRCVLEGVGFLFLLRGSILSEHSVAGMISILAVV